MVGKTAAERKAAQRKRWKRRGLKKREYYVTDAEHAYLQDCLENHRRDHERFLKIVRSARNQSSE